MIVYYECFNTVGIAHTYRLRIFQYVLFSRHFLLMQYFHSEISIDIAVKLVDQSASFQ